MQQPMLQQLKAAPAYECKLFVSWRAVSSCRGFRRGIMYRIAVSVTLHPPLQYAGE